MLVMARTTVALVHSSAVGVSVERTATTFAITFLPWRVSPASFTSHIASGWWFSSFSPHFDRLQLVGLDDLGVVRLWLREGVVEQLHLVLGDVHELRRLRLRGADRQVPAVRELVEPDEDLPSGLTVSPSAAERWPIE